MLKLLSVVILAGGLLGGLILGLRVAFPLPARPEASVPPSELPRTSDEPGLAGALSRLASDHPGLSGILPLERGADAFAARILLARNAVRSIDAQYYIWQNDLTGVRLLAELQDAARRGVRVRLLVDDNGTPDLDQELAALDALPNAEVRIFNPFTIRNVRAVNYLSDFSRLNRRMHNKSFTVDGIATIVGGRNVGDVYFETGMGHTYLDLDVLAVGPVADDVGQDFERYWRSPVAYPALSLVRPLPGSEGALEARDATLRQTPQGIAYAEVVRASELRTQIDSGTLPLEWVAAEVFSDDPAKVLGEVTDDGLLMKRLMAEIGVPEASFDIISAYFIPGDTSTGRMSMFAADGVRVRVLTNALETTDVVPVHAGYAKYREALVSAGVELWELRSEQGERRTVNELGLLEVSKAALHAKSFAVDRRLAFVGSLNFDPRSRRINTEMGLLIRSPVVAALISGWLDRNLSGIAYRVEAAEDGGLLWQATGPDGAVTWYEDEPNTTLPLRLLVALVGVLPIQWLL